MKRTAFDENRDQRTAADAYQDRALMCSAHNCPNRWSVDGGKGRLCSAHAWSERHLWPQITQEQIDAETDRAIARMAPKPEPVRFGREQRARCIAALTAWRDSLAAKPLGRDLGWAERLMRRMRGGETGLTAAQKAMAKSALRLESSGEQL